MSTPEHTTDSEKLAEAIRAEWREFGMADGEAKIGPRHPLHDEATDLVPADVPAHRPITVEVNGRTYTASRSNRYPAEVLFSG